MVVLKNLILPYLKSKLIINLSGAEWFWIHFQEEAIKCYIYLYNWSHFSIAFIWSFWIKILSLTILFKVAFYSILQGASLRSVLSFLACTGIIFYIFELHIFARFLTALPSTESKRIITAQGWRRAYTRTKDYSALSFKLKTESKGGGLGWG